MTRIGLLSDTHSYLDDKLFSLFEECDEIWHAGDIGSIDIIDQLEKFRPLRAVYGNIDGQEIRIRTHSILNFKLEDVHVIIHHYGGYPGHYDPRIRPTLQMEIPKLFICGHSHIVRVMRDPGLDGMLVVNPGAAGMHGFHKIRTAARFTLKEGKVSDFELIELGKRG